MRIDFIIMFVVGFEYLSFLHEGYKCGKFEIVAEKTDVKTCR